MGRLKSALLSKYKDLRDSPEEIKIFNPRNSEEVRLPFRGEKIAKVMGTLAAKHPTNGQILSGILVQKNFEMSILAVEDLPEFSGIGTTTVLQRQSVAVDASSELVKFHLQQMFGAVTDVSTDQEVGFCVMDAITVWCRKPSLVIEWEGNMINDAIADTVLAILLSVDSSPMSVKISSKGSHYTGHLDRPEKIERLLVFLDAQFGTTVEPMENPDDGVYIKIDQNVATVNFRSMEVICSYEPLRSRVRHVVDHAIGTFLPLNDNGSDFRNGDMDLDERELKSEE